MEKEKIKLTPLVFIMKAVVGSLKAYPAVLMPHSMQPVTI